MGKNEWYVIFHMFFIDFEHISTFFEKLANSSELKGKLKNFHKIPESLDLLYTSIDFWVFVVFSSKTREGDWLHRFSTRLFCIWLQLVVLEGNFRQTKTSQQIYESESGPTPLAFLRRQPSFTLVNLSEFLSIYEREATGSLISETSGICRCLWRVFTRWRQVAIAPRRDQRPTGVWHTNIEGEIRAPRPAG